jgi:HEAT repeat protein
MSEVPDKQEKKEEVSVKGQRMEREIPLDARLLSEAVIELNISRKNVGIYPPGHIQIVTSIDRAYGILQKMFEIRDEMTLGVAKDTLFVGSDYLDQKNPVYRDFALSLNQQGIAAVTFMRGLDKEELVRFHRILTTKTDDIRTDGGIENVMSDAGIPHIKIVAVDYSSFHVTEEQEISRPKAKMEERTDAHVWQDFVFHLSAGTLAAPGQGVSISEAEHIDPAELARLLNERKLDTSTAIESYDHIISTYVRGTAEKKQLTKEQSNTLARMNALLKDLHPELRKQFLSVAFNRLSSRTNAPADAAEVLGGFTDDMVIEMIGQANAEGREISPSLAGLVGKLTQAHNDASTGQTVDKNKQSPQNYVAPAVLPEHMQKLFDREKYEEFVSDEYQTMLKQLSEGVAVTVEPFPLEDYLKTLEDDRIDFQIGRALLAFLEENIDEEDYKEFAQKLISIMPQFLDSGNFELLWDVFETLRRHAAEKPVKGIRDIAEETRKFFTTPDFIIRALKAFELWMRDKGQEAVGLLQALGPDTVPGLLDIYSRDESVGGRRILFNLLCLFGDPAVREAQKRLRDPRAYYVRNLLILIRRAGTPSSVPSIKPLLQHRDQKVRIEAISTLLKFKDPDAVTVLRAAIHDNDPDVAADAVALAGQYRIADVTEDVLSKLKRVILFETDYAENEEIISALGNIGDPRAIPDLEKLAKASWSLYPQSLLRVKETIYNSLGRYPRESTARLVKIGERLNSDAIRRVCRQLEGKK